MLIRRIIQILCIFGLGFQQYYCMPSQKLSNCKSLEECKNIFKLFIKYGQSKTSETVANRPHGVFKWG